jgi:hypothetical protein
MAWPKGVLYVDVMDCEFAHREDGGPLTAKNCMRVAIHDVRNALETIGAPFEIETTYQFGWTLRAAVEESHERLAA